MCKSCNSLRQPRSSASSRFDRHMEIFFPQNVFICIFFCRKFVIERKTSCVIGVLWLVIGSVLQFPRWENRQGQIRGPMYRLRTGDPRGQRLQRQCRAGRCAEGVDVGHKSFATLSHLRC